MEHYQHVLAMKDETPNSRCVPCTRYPCGYTLKTIRVNIVVVCLVLICLGLWMFNRRDANTFSPLPLAGDRVSRQKSDGFSEGVNAGWSRWIERSQPQHIDDFNLLKEKSVSLKRKKIQKKTEKLKRDKGKSSSFSHKHHSRNSKKTKKLPNVIIIGVRKGGTLALLRYLSAHPQIASTHGEVHFFDKFYSLGMGWYRDQMTESTPGQLTLEKTPKYFIEDGVPELIHKMNSSVRLILTLRNPVSRALSDFAQIAEKPKYVNHSFTDFAIDPNTGDVNQNFKPINTSTYDLHFLRWRQFFPMKQIHIVDGDHLISSPLEEMKKIEGFLGIAPFFSEDVLYFNATRGFHCVRLPGNDGAGIPSCLGDSKGRQHPYVDSSVRTKLAQYFYPHNENLFRMLGRRFDWT